MQTTPENQQQSGQRREQQPCSPSSTPEADAGWAQYIQTGNEEEILNVARKLECERDALNNSCRLLAMLAAPTPRFFNPLHAIAAVEIRDKFLSENAKSAGTDASEKTL